MSSLYPDAKFILSLCRSEEAWFKSIEAHTQRRRWIGNRVVFGSEVANEGSREKYLEVYRRHNADVRKFFKGTGRLLEVVVEEEGNWERICGFLGVEECVEGREFPRANGKGEWGNRDVLGLYGIWDLVLGGVEKVLVEWFYGRGRFRVLSTSCFGNLSPFVA